MKKETKNKLLKDLDPLLSLGIPCSILINTDGAESFDLETTFKRKGLQSLTERLRDNNGKKTFPAQSENKVRTNIDVGSAGSGSSTVDGDEAS